MTVLRPDLLSAHRHAQRQAPRRGWNVVEEPAKPVCHSEHGGMMIGQAG